MKRLGALIIMLVCVVALSASPFYPFFWTLDQHPEIAAGFCPTYIGGGVGYRVSENRELQLLLKGGVTQYKLFWNPSTGLVEDGKNPLVFDNAEVAWRAQYLRGFGDSPAGDKSLVVLSGGYDGYYARSLDSMVTGEKRVNNGVSNEILSIDSWFNNPALQNDNPYYPDLGEMLGSSFFVHMRLDGMEDTLVTQDGYQLDFDLLWSPESCNRSLKGRADYYTAQANLVLASTLYSNQSDEGKNKLSFTFVNRSNITWVDGKQVSARAQKPVSLGRKVRGCYSWTYNTQLTMVNNTDLRICAPSLFVKSIVPRFVLFFDVGYGCGDYLNTSVQGDNLLCSSGLQMTVSFFDVFDLGIQYAYLISGKNYSGKGGNLITSATFFLDF